MASDDNIVTRTRARLAQFFGITNTSDLASGPAKKIGSVHYGMFNTSELRHVDGLTPNTRTPADVTEMDILEKLKSVSSNSKKMMDEIENLKIMAPELSMAETIIISSIMSPTDLQTDVVSITVDPENVSAETKTKINELLTNYFNDEFKLGPKLVDWLGTAGFHDGAKAIMILPQSELDVLNTVADAWDPGYKEEYLKMRQELAASTEALITDVSALKEVDMESQKLIATEALTDLNIGEEFMTDKEKKKFEELNAEKDKNGEIVKAVAPKTSLIAKDLVENSYKLLRPTEDGCGVIVTRDLSDLSKSYKAISSVTDQFQKEAERQIFGYTPEDPQGSKPQFPVLHISDIIKTNDGDLPILLEFPADSVIPVCAPGDHKNHLGYFILIDEYGRPVRGEYAFDGMENNDMVHRIATNCLRSVYGNRNISTFKVSGMSEDQIIDSTYKVFQVAVNYLLKNKLNKYGLRGLNINIHESVGKALFFNLLAKNQIKMLFIPEPMMVYYRFDHRDDGTGKTFLEDIRFLLALRCTLMIAKIMAAIDNATKHRVIEVQVDSKNVNPLETMELARQMFINKKAPNITNDPRTAVESIINQHLSVRPKGMQGVVDDLSITHETQYGQSQMPDDGFLDTINNMIGQGLKIPATVLNNLNEAEYARSVATSNLFFANNVRNWQAIIKPFNKKFLINYILSNRQLLDEIKKILDEDLKGSQDEKTKENTSQCIQENQDKTAEDFVKKTLSTVELVLAPPNMSTSKAHFEELNAQTDAIDKLLNLIYPDDIAVNDELRSIMSSLRALIASKLVREFLPKLGVHEIADVPSVDEIDTEQVKNVLLFLNNLKKRADDLTKLAKGELSDAPGGEGGESTDFTPSEPGEEGGEGNPEDATAQLDNATQAPPEF